MTVRVIVVDDHAVFREGLRSLLARSEGVEVVGEAATTDDALAVTRSTRPDVVLMDLHLPGEGGLHATSVIVAEAEAPAVLVLTMNSDDALVRRAISAGAGGYLLKDAQPDAIVRAVLAVHSGQMVLDAEVARSALRGSPAPGERAFPSLTEREFEILERIARGLRNEAIAARLGISVKTVQNTVSVIFLKLRARDRAHAVALARDAGVGTG